MPTTARTLARRPPSLLSADASPAEAEVLRLAALSAEEAGDFEGARRLVCGLPDTRSSRRWYRQLVGAVMLDPADLAGLACWIVHPAMRWAMERSAGSIFERHAELMLKTMGVGVADRVRRVPFVAWGDAVVVDAALFDTSLFGDYLAAMAEAPLLARIPEVEQWPAQPSLIWEVVTVGPQELVVRDLYDQRERSARRNLAAEGLTEGALVYGRLLPVAGDPGLAFALPPATVDRRCAARLVRARRQGSNPEERLRAVGHSRRRAIQAGQSRL